MKNIEQQIKEGKIILDFYHYLVPKSAIYILGEMYRYRFAESDTLTGFCAIEKIFYNLSYFNNHFISMDISNFLLEIRSMLYVKKYPLGIIFRKREKEDYCLLFGCKGKEVEYFIYELDKELQKYTEKQLQGFIDDSIVEWYVAIPPRMNMKKSSTMLITFNKAVMYLNNHLKELDYVDEIDLHLIYLIEYMKYIEKIIPDLVMNEYVSEYEELYYIYIKNNNLSFEMKKELLEREKIILIKLNELLNHILNYSLVG